MLITDDAGSMDFEHLLRVHEARVLRLAIRLTGNTSDGQDAAQEVFLRLHRHLHSLSGPADVAPWLRKVTLNVCFDHSRSIRSRPRAVPLDGIAAVSREADPEQLHASSEANHRLQAALLQLGEKERAALVLRELEGLTTGEVADVLGTAESTVRVQIARARLKLRELLKGVVR